MQFGVYLYDNLVKRKGISKIFVFSVLFNFVRSYLMERKQYLGM